MGTNLQGKMEALVRQLQKLELLDRISSQSEAVHSSLNYVEENLHENQKKMREIARKLNQVEKENALISSRLNLIENRKRQKNLIILNFKETEANAADLKKTLLNFFSRKMGLDLPACKLSRVVRIGSHRPSLSRPIRITLTDNQSKWKILLSTRFLKGCKIGIMRDLPNSARVINRQLIAYRKMLSSHGIHSKIRGLKLETKHRIYTVTDLQREFPRSGSSKTNK